jgi:hypothetical protein
MRTAPIGPAPVATEQSKPALGIAAVGLALLCGGAMAWIVKQRHWAPKVTFGVGGVASLVGLCCYRRLSGTLAAAPEAQQPGAVADAGHDTVLPNGKALFQVRLLNGTEWRQTAIELLSNEQIDGIALYRQMAEHKLFRFQDRAYQELFEAVELLRVYFEQPGARGVLPDRLGQYLGDRFRQLCGSPVEARIQFLMGLTVICRDGRFPPGLQWLWDALPTGLPTGDQPPLSADRIRSLIQFLQEPTQGHAAFLKWRRHSAAPYIFEWALALGDPSISGLAANFLAEWSDEFNSTVMHSELIDRISPSRLGISAEELAQRLVPFQEEWVSEIEDEFLSQWVASRLKQICLPGAQ